MEWDTLISGIKSCHLCEGLNLAKFGTLNAPGYGNRTSKVVFIGQSLCGTKCIESQIPFTGGSGKILDQAFQLVNIDKKDIYITNIVKCHPPRNRKSNEHEIKNCSPYLKKELDWVEPKQIVCLGKDAWKYFNNSIEKPCNKEMFVNGKTTMVHFIYHPSYIKRKSKEEQKHYVASIATILKLK